MKAMKKPHKGDILRVRKGLVLVHVAEGDTRWVSTAVVKSFFTELLGKGVRGKRQVSRAHLMVQRNRQITAGKCIWCGGPQEEERKGKLLCLGCCERQKVQKLALKEKAQKETKKIEREARKAEREAIRLAEERRAKRLERKTLTAKGERQTKVTALSKKALKAAA